MIFEKVSKTMENVRNIDILNLSQQKNEGIIQYHHKIIKLQSFSQNFRNRNKKAKQKTKQRDFLINLSI